MLVGRPSLTARWAASHRARMGPRRPTVDHGDAGAERALYAGLSRRFLVLPGMAPTGMAIRTGFIDCETVDALSRGIEQVVILGAGYDGRPLRFGPSARWIEVDHPKTQQDKQRRVMALDRPTDHIVFAPVDLSVDDLDQALEAAGHRTDEPTLFLAEGLFPYLPIEVTRHLCSTIRRRAAPGSVFVSNYRVVPRKGARGRGLRAVVDAVLVAIGERRLAEFYEGDPESRLTGAGWSPVRAERSSPNRVDQGTFLLVVASEPAY